MRIFMLIIGTMAIAHTPIFTTQAQAQTVYQKIYAAEKQRISERTTRRVEVFLPRVLPSKELRIVDTDVDEALIFSKQTICVPEKNNKNPVPEMQCQSTILATQEIAQNMQWLQHTIHSLQISAAGYEMGTNYYGGNATAVLTRLPSIAGMWRSHVDEMTSPYLDTRVQAGVYTNNIAEETDRIATALKELITIENNKKNDEKFIAAVWRYRHGIPQGDCEEAGPSNMGDGTELQFVHARFCDVEIALQNFLNTISVNQKPTELVLYPVLQLPGYPIIIWVRNDTVGLQWKAGVDPILPSLNCDAAHSYDQPSDVCNSSGAILGGRYPPEMPEPEPVEGLCSHPIAKRGY